MLPVLQQPDRIRTRPSRSNLLEPSDVTPPDDKLPTYDRLMNPLLRALRELGGSGTIDEINAAVYQVANIPEEVIAIPHGAPGGRGEVAYRLAWARTYLGKYGALENSSRGVWAIRSEFNAETVDPKEVIRVVRALDGGEEVVPVVPCLLYTSPSPRD